MPKWPFFNSLFVFQVHTLVTDIIRLNPDDPAFKLKANTTAGKPAMFFNQHFTVMSL